MSDGLLTSSGKWHESQIRRWQWQDQQHELDDLLKTLSYRTTDAEYSAFMLTVRGKVTPVAIRMIRDEIERVNHVSREEVLRARDQLEIACRDLDHCRETYGGHCETTWNAVDLMMQKDAELVGLVQLAAEHPEILDAAADDDMYDALRHGG